MATKKPARKAARKSSSRASKSTVAAAPTQVRTIVNGQVMGSIAPEGTIGDAANKLARDNGLKAFSLRVNGVAVTATEAAGELAGVQTIEVFAKDTRG